MSEAGNWKVQPLLVGRVNYPERHPRAGEIGPVFVYLLERAGTRILVDTGIGPAHEVIDGLYSPWRRDLLVALAMDCGATRDEIDAIVLSHLHFDHMGGAQEFRGTPIYVQRAEWAAAQAPKYTIPEWLEFPGANLRLMDGDFELEPGVRVILTPGHTPGHQVIAVATSEGVAALAGQAVETCAEYEALLAGREPMPAGARRITEAGPAAVYFSHDERVWRTATDPA